MAKYNEKNFIKDETHVNQIEDLIEKDEEIIWKGKPKKSAFIWSKILYLLPFALIWGLFDGFFIYMIASNNVFGSIPTIMVIFIIFFFLFHLTPVWIWLSNVLTAFAQHKNIEYALTSKRIIVRSGILVNLENIYYMDIQSVNLKVGLIDRILKVGDIYMTTKTKTIVLWDIENPYVIANKLQKIVNDIKTDMYFPNELRPEENQGYKTNYKFDKEFNKNNINKNK